MSRLSEEVAYYLQNQGLGTVGQNIFVSFIPDSPDSLICVIDSGGYPSDVYAPIDNPTIQIRVRDVNYPACHDKAWTIYDLFNRNIEYYLGSLRILYSYVMQTPVYIGRDTKQREEFSLNIYFHIIR